MMRYAIYFTPQPSDPLTIAAQSWLGRDAFNDKAVPLADCDGFPAGDLWHHTAEPRRYGFHATLVAPFHLAAGIGEQDLLQAMDRFAGSRATFHIPRLDIVRLDNFFALAPAAPCPQLDALAWSAVDHFNGLRAPLSDSEIRRRSMRDLSLRQVGYLMRYGYPYVRDEFRFHMTLSNSTSYPPEGLEAALLSHFSPIIATPVAVDSIALFVEPEPDAPFTIHSMHRFGSAEAKKSG